MNWYKIAQGQENKGNNNAIFSNMKSRFNKLKENLDEPLSPAALYQAHRTFQEFKYYLNLLYEEPENTEMLEFYGAYLESFEDKYGQEESQNTENMNFNDRMEYLAVKLGNELMDIQEEVERIVYFDRSRDTTQNQFTAQSLNNKLSVLKDDIDYFLRISENYDNDFVQFFRRNILLIIESIKKGVAKISDKFDIPIPIAPGLMSKYQMSLGNFNHFKTRKESFAMNDENEYASEEGLIDLPKNYIVKILNDVYTVEDLESKDFKIKYSPERNWIFIFAKIKFEWSPKELPYRSVIVDTDGNIVSAGWPKFFNYGESKYSEEIDRVFSNAIQNESPNLIFTHKYDGTLIIRSVIGDQIIFRTRGTLEGREFGEAAKEIAKDKYPQLLDSDYFPDISLLFEYIGPHNRIVVGYEESDLILIGAIKHRNLTPLTWFELEQIDNSLRLVETYSLHGKNMEEINNFLSQYPNLIEGLVVRINGQLTKIKTEDYLRLHRLKSEINYNKVVDLVSANNITKWSELEDIIKDLQWDTEWFSQIKEYFDIYQEKLEVSKQIIYEAKKLANKIIDNSIIDDKRRKAEFAQSIKRFPALVKTILFAAYDGKLDKIFYDNFDKNELESLEDILEFLKLQ